MSLLAPLYFLGALAVAFPVLLHLIRRTPKGRQEFSSLMFLSPSPPRITRRSRIEHWLLLLLRAAAICLLALAFARPFLRETAVLMGDNGPGKRTAIVLDTSASMQRGNLWQEAVERAAREIRAAAPTDQLSLYAFDEQLRVLVDWNEPLSESSSRQARLLGALGDLKPGWGRSNVGSALASVAEQLAGDRAEQDAQRDAEIVLISDCQQGSDTSALRGYPWPEEVLLRIEKVKSNVTDNASVRLLASDEPGVWRVRVANAIDSSSEQFTVAWGKGNEPKSEPGESVYVPPGQSRIVRMPEPSPDVDRIRISGDAATFDNEFFVAPIKQREVRVVFLGSESPDDVNGMRYFFDRVWNETPRRKVRVESAAIETVTDKPSGDRPLIVVASELAAEQTTALRDYVKYGGSALLVVSAKETAQSLASLAESVELTEETDSANQSGSHALLGEINFQHPVFAAFAGPRYNDFTKVRVWKHQRFKLGETEAESVLARFDNGDPAIWEQTLGAGKLLWLACGWRPSDSQLALSSKFVPILSSMLDYLTGTTAEEQPTLQVNEPLPLSDIHGEGPIAITKPDSEVVMLDVGTSHFDAAIRPGVYRAQRGSEQVAFAVNLHPDESNTAPLEAAHFEELGVQTGTRPSAEQQLARQRQMRDIELESRQKLWKWLLVGVLGVLAVETSLGGRIARRATRSETKHD